MEPWKRKGVQEHGFQVLEVRMKDTTIRKLWGSIRCVRRRWFTGVTAGECVGFQGTP